jgi:hypothetical protein
MGVTSSEEAGGIGGGLQASVYLSLQCLEGHVTTAMGFKPFPFPLPKGLGTSYSTALLQCLICKMDT